MFCCLNAICICKFHFQRKQQRLDIKKQTFLVEKLNISCNCPNVLQLKVPEVFYRWKNIVIFEVNEFILHLPPTELKEGVEQRANSGTVPVHPVAWYGCPRVVSAASQLHSQVIQSQHRQHGPSGGALQVTWSFTVIFSWADAGSVSDCLFCCAVLGLAGQARTLSWTACWNRYHTKEPLTFLASWSTSGHKETSWFRLRSEFNLLLKHMQYFILIMQQRWVG